MDIFQLNTMHDFYPVDFGVPTFMISIKDNKRLREKAIFFIKI